MTAVAASMEDQRFSHGKSGLPPGPPLVKMSRTMAMIMMNPPKENIPQSASFVLRGNRIDIAREIGKAIIRASVMTSKAVERRRVRFMRGMRCC